jgi:hypothetical protein
MSVPEALPPWRPLLRSAREREGRSPQARWLQLVMVAADGTPRVRTLVFGAGPVLWTGNGSAQRWPQCCIDKEKSF